MFVLETHGRSIQFFWITLALHITTLGNISGPFPFGVVLQPA